MPTLPYSGAGTQHAAGAQVLVKGHRRLVRGHVRLRPPRWLWAGNHHLVRWEESWEGRCGLLIISEPQRHYQLRNLINFPPTFTFSRSCSASRISSSIYRLNSIGESVHLCLTSLPIDPGSESSPSMLTLIPMYRFPINILWKCS